ncbi:MAG: hypothetical protein CBC29_08910 [Methylococcaceae bacterium TMED69]|nr:MAG: hypothetical protein CBC29_08910 [Methylococcaceae bacterium TMED69]|tara:strand:- start:338 stop:712 length:375 start_codon:yes stop_codon:yes gene_type:complete
MSEEIRCINYSFAVPKESSEEVEVVFRKHAAWMEEFYSEDNNGQKHLLNSYFTKAPEFVDPTDHSKGKTGNIVFTINERFTSLKSVVRHTEFAMKNDYFEEIANIFQNYAKVLSNSGIIYHSIR